MISGIGTPWCLFTFRQNALTHWGRDKMDAIFQTTFSNEFSWMKMYEFRFPFHWSLFLGVQITIFQHWFRYWLGADQAPSHYLNQWWLDYRRIYASLGLNELTTNITKTRNRVKSLTTDPRKKIKPRSLQISWVFRQRFLWTTVWQRLH